MPKNDELQKKIDESSKIVYQEINKVEFNWKSARAKAAIVHLYGGALVSAQFNINVEGKRANFTAYKDGAQSSNKLTKNHLKIIASIMNELEPLFDV